MGEHVAHIEIYLNDKKPSYEIEDNHPDFLFSPYLFMECIHRFYLTDSDKPVYIPLDSLKQRKEILNRKVMTPSDVNYKIDALIKFITNHISTYRGISVIGDNFGCV